ncbi:hypothetical protein K8T06_03830 [bacterium]|nr:hypothetical protein [bacterium]
MRTIMIAIGFVFSLMFGSILAQTMPSTLTITQWQDSWLAKWQSAEPEDKNQSMAQLAALLLIIDNDAPEISGLKNRLATQTEISIEADIALALQLLQIGFPDKAAQKLLDLILKYPDDFRINRFRIGLARAFRQDGQFELAAAQLEPIMDLHTSDGRWATLERARLYQTQNNSKLAIELYEQIENSNASMFLKQTAHKEKLDSSFRSALSLETSEE